MFSFTKRPLMKPTMVATWEKSSWRFAFFWISSSEQKESLLKSLASFLSEGRSNTVCEMRVAWVWLFQKASACYCLPSQLLQAPAPWLPYMRDQGLPRCFWERRAQCEMGQTSPQNTHFLCMLGALVGIQMGSVTQQLGLGFSLLRLFLLENCCLPLQWLATAICCLYSMWLDNKLSLPERKFVQTLTVYPVADRGTSCRKGRSNSVHFSFLPKSSVTEPRH